jgi:NADH-quinone oxidoreductase subunit A
VNGERPFLASTFGSRILFAWLREKKHKVLARENVVQFPSPVPASFDLATYYPIFLYLAAILLFALVSIVMAQTIGPKRRTAVKLMPYESGMDPIGDARQHFDVKFYLTAILFLVFDVELLFLYPWAVVAYHQPNVLPSDLKGPVFWEVMIFLSTLAVAYVYAWRKGVFRWR